MRRVVHLTIIAIIAVVVNISVAWLSALYVDVERGYYEHAWDQVDCDEHGCTTFLMDSWRRVSAARFSAEAQTPTERGSGNREPSNPKWFFPRSLRSRLSSPDHENSHWGPLSANYYRMIDVRGFPMPCLWSQGDFDNEANDITWTRGIVVDESTPFLDLWNRYELPVLPFGVMPIPFTVDLLFYFGCLTAVYWVFCLFVRVRRYQRGLCPVCRYDLRHSFGSGCAECGWAPRRTA